MKKIFSIFSLSLFMFLLIACDPQVKEDDDDDIEDNTNYSEVALNSVSNYVTQDTTDNLLLESSVATYTYTSSNPNLYIIKDGLGFVNKVEQKHQEQTVTITLDVSYKDGTTDKLTKDITVGPIIYPDINDTPIASYFYTQAMSLYFSNSAHYKEEGDIFSSIAKEGLDLIYYSFVTPSKNGTLRIDNASYIELVKPLKAHDVRVLFTIDGVSQATSDAFKEITATKEGIDNFVTNIMDLVDAYGFDGVDIDWEPFAGGVIPNQLNNFMIAMREEMDKRQAEGGTPYILSAAVPGHEGTLPPRWFDLPTLGGVVDYINFMNYAMQSTGRTSHMTPVNGQYGVSTLIEYLKRIDFPLNKVIVGSGTYGKAYKLNTIGADNPMGQSATFYQFPDLYNKGSFASGTMYVQAIEEVMKLDGYVEGHEYQNGLLRGGYLYNKTEGIFITYETTTSAKAKVDIISKYPGMGIMTWAYSQDANNYIMNAIINARKENQTN